MNIKFKSFNVLVFIFFLLLLSCSAFSAEIETKPTEKSNPKEIEETYSANHIKVEFLQEHVKSLYPEALNGFLEMLRQVIN